MLTGALLRTAVAWPDGVVEDGPEGWFAGEALMMALSRWVSKARGDGGSLRQRRERELLPQVPKECMHKQQRAAGVQRWSLCWRQ